ncbi:hypothetical protein MF406_15545 [Georgenia sp. TF02-10]|uniref:hypothetical protein n=1 Tax=Georgenia sp. TF02-10 TaxID=2917725 RepID=UPI001FA701F5|nr:hypothetical protein [Georgenia sp. TF02-10]UNX54317.1 hypothetical protein MF406_15545 [Georgenia sp. TF02-10]
MHAPVEIQGALVVANPETGGLLESESIDSADSGAPARWMARASSPYADPRSVDAGLHAENGWPTLAAFKRRHAADPEAPAAVRPGGRLEFDQAAQVC